MYPHPPTIHRYQIRDTLGIGGMATVYRAFDPQFQREVAIKVLARELLHKEEFLARFKREATTVASLEHPAIVPVYDFGEADGQPYLVMRLMSGGSLKDRLEKGQLSLNEIARLFIRLASALDYAHRKGVIHRDLKPGNILFDQDGEPYLADFGIVRLTEATTNLTGTEGWVGTPAYMSPEQGRGQKDIDHRSDIYALGAMLFEMLTGRIPYEADTPNGQVIQHIIEPIPNALSLRPGLPEESQRIVAQAMAKTPHGRYATVGEMAADLDAIAKGRPLPKVRRTPTLRPLIPENEASHRLPEPSPRRAALVRFVTTLPRWGWLAFGLALLILMGFGLRNSCITRGTCSTSTLPTPLAVISTQTPTPPPTHTPPTSAQAPTRQSSPTPSTPTPDGSGVGTVVTPCGANGPTPTPAVSKSTSSFDLEPWFFSEPDNTLSVAWGDVDDDGDLDLAVGNTGPQGSPNKLYLNMGRELEKIASWSSNESDKTNSVAWADVDCDGDIDLAAGNDGAPNRVYLNEDGVLEKTASWTSDESAETYSIAWGDLNGDGYPDLAVGNKGANQVYLNRDGVLETTASWTSADSDETRSVAWGDMDGDGDLDLAAGNDGSPNRVYLNRDGVLETTASWTSDDSDGTRSVAWGDVNGDGLPDLAVGNLVDPNRGAPNKVYLNRGGTLETTASWISDEKDITLSVAWGDVDGDGDLDLAVGNNGPDKVYLNTGSELEKTAFWTSSFNNDETRSVAWGDVDGDGDLDLAVGNRGASNLVYMNDRVEESNASGDGKREGDGSQPTLWTPVLTAATFAAFTLTLIYRRFWSDSNGGSFRH